MEALKNNKFLATYCAVLAVGTLGLGYLCFSKKSAASAALSEYENIRREVEGLESKPLFPSKANLTKAQEAVTSFKSKVDQLQKKLGALNSPLDSKVDGSEFKVRLGKAIADIKALAEANNVKVDKEIDLGFTKYVQDTPGRDAVADLNFSLNSIQALTETIIKSHAVSIGPITRGELAVESNKPVAEDPSKNPKPGSKASTPTKTAAPAAVAVTEKDVLVRYPFEVAFTGPATAVEEVINAMASTSEGSQLYSLRFLRLDASKKLGPSKSGIEFGRSSDDKKGKEKDCAVILGSELVTARLYVDIVRVLDPSAKAPAANDAATKPAAKTASR